MELRGKLPGLNYTPNLRIVACLIMCIKEVKFLLRNAKHFQTKIKKKNYTQEIVHIIKRATVVEEHSIVGRR